MTFKTHTLLIKKHFIILGLSQNHGLIFELTNDTKNTKFTSVYHVFFITHESENKQVSKQVSIILNQGQQFCDATDNDRCNQYLSNSCRKGQAILTVMPLNSCVLVCTEDIS